MSESEWVTAVHGKTKLVQSIPRHYLIEYPDFRELNDAEIVERQRGKEKKMFGEHITPAHKPKAVAKPDEAPKEGGK
jgi:hypothetical protein